MIFRRSSGALNLAVGLWSLRIKYNHGCRGGFSPPLSLGSRARARENPPLRWIAWLHLIFKDHKPTVGAKNFSPSLTRRRPA